jgi:C4-dicarboxylate-binding protein DctP
MLPFADMPLALSQHVVDALESTAETIRTAQLWDTGLRLCVRQQAVLLQYVPLISGRLWAEATPRLREGVLGIWDEVTQDIRVEAAERQSEARLECQRNGIRMLEPSLAAVAGARAILAAASDDIVRKLGIDADLAARAAAMAS